MDLVIESIRKANADQKMSHMIYESFFAQAGDKQINTGLAPDIPTLRAPIYMAAGNKFKKDVPAGATISCDMVAEPEDSRLWELRRQQVFLYDINPVAPDCLDQNGFKNEVSKSSMQTQRSRKIIVAAAPVGTDIAPPSINPLTPTEVADEVIVCTQAGASMVHLHVRDSRGNQTEDISDFSKTLDHIRESSDIMIQGSTGGLTSLSLEER
jgi:hypothetical protein